MRFWRRSFVVSLVALAGCTGAQGCGDHPGEACIPFEVRALGGAPLQVGQLRLTADSFPLVDAPTPLVPLAQPTPLPLVVAVLPGASFAGDFTLYADAVNRGTVVGQGSTHDRIVN